MARFVKSTFAPVIRVPPEVLSLIPYHRERDGKLIRLARVCRSWREVFIPWASLWTLMDCKNPAKTSSYLFRRGCQCDRIDLGIVEGCQRPTLVLIISVIRQI